MAQHDDLHFTEEALRSQDGKTVPLTAYPGGPIIGEATFKYTEDGQALKFDAKITDPKFEFALARPGVDFDHISQRRVMPADEIVRMEGVRLVFRNFTGKETTFNQPGSRNFGVILPPEVAEDMKADGWNVKTLNPREEELEENPESEGAPWLPVKVAYDKGRPPRIFTVTDRGKVLMREETVEQLDWVDILNVDMSVRPYHYDARGNTGIAAYVQTMYVTIDEDPLDRKYAEVTEQ